VKASEIGGISSTLKVQNHCFERKGVEVEGLTGVASGGARLSRAVTGRGACYCVEERKKVEKGYAGNSVVYM
jgi:hypothetical protein